MNPGIHLRLFPLLLCFFLGVSYLHSQSSVSFKTGSFSLLPAKLSNRSAGQQYLFYQAEHTLSHKERSDLQDSGIEILYALHDYLYWVRVTKTQDTQMAGRLFEINPDFKVGVDLNNRTGDKRFRISIAPGMNPEEINDWALRNEIVLLDTRPLSYGMIDVELKENNIDALIGTSWISYIGSIPHDEEINYRAYHGERGWGLTSPLSRNLNGTGITIGIGDGGNIGIHDDLSTSILDLASYGVHTHVIHVTGIVAGAGLIDPFYGRGYAPKANIILRNFSDILWDSPQYISDYGMSLTNNSYGNDLGNCVYFGDYDGTSAALDAMVFDHPELLHVFAAANSGGMNCTPYSSGFATIAGGYQPAKNLLTVGAVDNTDVVTGFSSRGPVDDGRLKPEVVAYGAGRFSTSNNHNYGSGSGTSFSCPGTTGIAALLYERYKELNADSLPDAALIKNVICNAADDLGNTGPDYRYGFGRINGERAVAILEDNHYQSVEIEQTETINIPIIIPAGTAFTDVMLLWTDYPSAPFETVTLVNDLDLTVVTPTGDTLKPWKLNYTPSGVANAAATGADHLNNYEQVTIPTPASGTYTIVVNGYNVPMGPQKAWISWDHCLSGITVQGPIGGEVYKPGNVNVPGDRQYIRWDAYGTGSALFNVEYSTNGGGAWTMLVDSIPSSRRYQDWFPPNVPTDKFKVRVTATNGMQDTSSQNAVIMAAPGGLSASSPCRGYVQANWNAVTGASYYRIYTIKNEVLTPVDTTSSTSIILSDFPSDSVVWVSVSGVFASGTNGLRARAVQVTANGGNNCAWDHDLRLDSIVGLTSGRIQTSSELTSAEQVTIRITNAGTMTASGFALTFSLDNNNPFTENFPGNLNSGTGQDFTFNKTVNLSAPGTYTLKIWLTYASDPFPQNDTLTIPIKHLPNPVISLPWNENFDSVPDTAWIANSKGMPLLDAWDVYLQQNARVRTFAGNPFCHSGERAMTVDAIRTGANKNADLIFTLNLDTYSVMDDDVRLNLHVMHHEIFSDTTTNEVIWIRGSDTDPFVLLTNLSNDASLRGQWQYLSGLELTTALDNAGQDFSSSFQVKFAHGVYASAGQLTSEDGQTIDDLSIHLVQQDIKVNAILQPTPIACDLGLDTIRISVQNTSALSVTNATAYYRLNGGTIHPTFIGNIPADTAIMVSLLPPADFSAYGNYDLKVWVYSADDDFHFNDTTTIMVLHTQGIHAFPYTESFELGDGGYVTGGISTTWVHGIPGKQTISRAAEGQNVWTTSLSGTHNADETSYLYSPCFDLQGLVQPYISFAFQYLLEAGYDYAWMEYRLEGSDTWIKLGTQGSGANWYNHATNTWNGNQLKWVTTGNAIPVSDTTVQFRWVMQSDVGVELEGLAIDQVHVYDRKPLYNGGNMPWTIPVSGNDWVHIEQAGQRVFSIHPDGQDLGNVTVSLYKSGSNFHLADSLYLLSRNWVVTSTNPPSGEIKLRGYFTKTEADNLVSASGCSQCISARDGFDFAALRYTGINQDGNYGNDLPAQVTTYPLDSTDIIPFDNGYFAEWTTTGLSEWWITSTVTKWSGEIERQISAAYDDAEEHEDNGSVNPVREYLSLTDNDGHQKIGWRFKNITIPKNSYISSAHIEWMASDTSSLPSVWTLQAELVADASSFITSKYNLSLRPRTAQVVQWIPIPWNSVDAAYTSPDIRHLIQSIVDQSTWVNGNDMVLLLKGNGWREAWSYDGDPLKGAKLIINYDSICLTSGICYVDQDANGNQDGSSWAQAYRSLEQALDRAQHCPDITQIWIAEGTYRPYEEVNRSTGYVIPPGVSIYGGFEGDESSINERIYGAFPTFLSGDIGLANTSSDNLYHVVTISTGAETSLLDGITIVNGLANGVTPDLQTGSGLYILGKLSINQVVVDDCSAPAVYSGPGSQLTNTGSLEVRQ